MWQANKGGGCPIREAAARPWFWFLTMAQTGLDNSGEKLAIKAHMPCRVTLPYGAAQQTCMSDAWAHY